MAFSMAGSGPSHPEMNVTPLIDVLLVLIIIFMIVVTQQKRKGLDAQIPEPQQKAAVDFVDRTIVIQVMAGAKDEPPALKINQESVSWEHLESRLQDIFKTRAERVAFVRSDDDVDFQYVADAIDMAREAGVERVGLLGKE
jgi:biopolymer transport protein TolR